MKLKNKKTGEIGYTAVLRSKAIVVMDENAIQLGSYTSLAELNEEWEDYEEEKRYWYIDADGEIMSKEMAWFNQAQDDIGNRFETKEEAEKAVEKLEAWKRLKDEGFRFTGYSRYDWNGDESPAVAFEYSDFDKMFDDRRVEADLDLLFGGEE